MAQRKPGEKYNLDRVLELAEQLTPEEQEQLVDRLKLRWLQRAAGEAEKSLADGKVVSKEELEKRLDSIKEEIETRQK